MKKKLKGVVDSSQSICCTVPHAQKARTSSIIGKFQETYINFNRKKENDQSLCSF